MSISVYRRGFGLRRLRIITLVVLRRSARFKLPFGRRRRRSAVVAPIGGGVKGESPAVFSRLKRRTRSEPFGSLRRCSAVIGAIILPLEMRQEAHSLPNPQRNAHLFRSYGHKTFYDRRNAIYCRKCG